MAYATRSRGSDLSSSQRTTMTPNRLSSVQNVSTHATQLPSPLVSAPAVLPAPTDSMENVTWTASAMTDQVQPSKDDRYYQMIPQNALKNHHVRFKDSGNDISQPHDDFDTTSNARDNLDIDLNLSHMNHQMQSNRDRKRGGRREIEGEDTIRLRDRLGLSNQLPQEPPRMTMKSSLSTNIPDESSLPRHVRFEMDSPLNLSVGQHLRYEERDGAGMDVDAAEGSGTKLTTEHEGGSGMDMEIESLSFRSGNNVESEGSGLIARAGRAFSSILFSKPEENGLSLNSDMEEDGEVHITREITQSGDSSALAPHHSQNSTSVSTSTNASTSSSTTITSTTTNRTTSTSQKDKSRSDKRRLRREIQAEAIASHQLSEKSEMDRQTARAAIISLDNDVVLLQRRLQEKEDALRDAESRVAEFQRVAIHTETLTREIHTLETTIQELQQDIRVKEQSLEQLQQHRQSHEHKIQQLSQDLRAKEIAQADAETIQRDLDEANKRRAQLMVQIQSLKDAVQVRDSEIRGAHATIADLESSLQDHSEEKERNVESMSVLRKEMTDREHELEKCHKTIQAMKDAQGTVESLEEQLQSMRRPLDAATSELKELQKKKRSLIKDNGRVEKLTEDVRYLKAKVKDMEFHLGEARATVKELSVTKQRSEELEQELKALREQALVQETHLTYLEDIANAHESCGADIHQLQKEVHDLQTQMQDKEETIVALQKEINDADKEQHIQRLQLEMQTLMHEMETKERAAEVVKERSDDDHKKVSSTVSALRTEVEGLRQMLRTKSQSLEDANKRIQDLESAEMTTKTLSTEVDNLRQLLRTKSKSLKEANKKGEDLHAANLNVNALKLEVDNFRRVLQEKSQYLKEAKIKVKELAIEKEKNMNLTLEVTSLERMVWDKDLQIAAVNKLLDSMRERADKARQLQSEVKELHKNLTRADRAVDNSTRDLMAASSTASKLIVDVESLRERLAQKERDLLLADTEIKDLRLKSEQVSELLVKIDQLEQSQNSHAKNSEEAKDKVESLEAYIKAVESYVGDLQQRLRFKETKFQSTINKATKGRDVIVKKLEESQVKVKELRTQYEETEKDTKIRIRDKEDQIKSLEKELEAWEKHEESWIVKTLDLTNELACGMSVQLDKDHVIQKLQYMIQEDNLEVSRLNEAINDARMELREDRKRRAHESEEEVQQKTLLLKIDKDSLQKTVTDLQNQIEHLHKRIRLDQDHEANEMELSERIHELNYWKQNATEQINEWEAMVVHLEEENVRLVGELKQSECRIHSLETMVDNAEGRRLKAVEQTENLVAMIATHKKKLTMLRGVLAQHDVNDARFNESMHALNLKVDEAEAAKEELSQEVRAKEARIAQLEARLRSEMSSYKVHLADARHKIEDRDRTVEMLHSSIADHVERNAEMESEVAKDRDSLLTLERTLDKLRGSLSAQILKYRSLDHRYQAVLAMQGDQEQKFLKLEKRLAYASARGTDKNRHFQSHVRRLESELERALQKTNDLQLEVHSVTASYHDILAQLKATSKKRAQITPQDTGNHDTCAARVQAGESEVAKLSARISELNETLAHMTRDHAAREQEWVRTEEGYKDRVELMFKSHRVLENQLVDVTKMRDQERAGREGDRVKYERERRMMDETMQGLRQQNEKVQKEHALLEASMRNEMTTTRDLTALLAKVRRSIKRGSESELRSLDELESELKSRESLVEETIMTTRIRMDSGIFEGNSMQGAAAH